MSVLPIVTYNDEVLHKKAEPIKEYSEELHKFINDMFDTMYNSDGVGLAAPQVGKLLRIFVADADPMAKQEDEPLHGPVAMINPEITYQSEQEVVMEEGCLSIPGVNASITRPEEISVQYRDENFNPRELEAGGWLARIIQHEIDHLEGILFLDHLSIFKRKLWGSKLKEIEEGRKEINYPVVPKKAQAE